MLRPHLPVDVLPAHREHREAGFAEEAAQDDGDARAAGGADQALAGAEERRIAPVPPVRVIGVILPAVRGAVCDNSVSGGTIIPVRAGGQWRRGNEDSQKYSENRLFHRENPPKEGGFSFSVPCAWFPVKKMINLE